MLEEKILSGEQTEKQFSGSVIASDDRPSISKSGVSDTSTLKDRISASTESKGLKKLPDGFDDQNGDWKTINSENTFEILYLDYYQYKFITPEIVKNNYTILEKFWKSKMEIMNTGGNRIQFKTKYGDRTVENSLTNLKRAYVKINTEGGIEEYYKEINNKRLKKGEESLRKEIESMCVDGVADNIEIKLILKNGLEFELSDEETSIIIKTALDNKGFVPYGLISGKTIHKQLLSIDAWMLPQKKEEADRRKRETEAFKIQILPGKYASTIEEIGTILFEYPNEAKKIIKEDLLKPVIAQKDMVLAMSIGNISKNKKNIDVTYLEIIYTLNPKLPYKFKNKNLNNVKELCKAICKNVETINLGKEHLLNGYIDTWLKKSDSYSYEKFISIQNKVINFELKFLEFIYTFNSKLPYLFANKILINTPIELIKEIVENIDLYSVGNEEFLNKNILTWLRLRGEHTKIKFEELQKCSFIEFLYEIADKTYIKSVNDISMKIEMIESQTKLTKEHLNTNKISAFKKKNGITFIENLLIVIYLFLVAFSFIQIIFK